MELTLEEIERAIESRGARHFNDLSRGEQEALLDWIDGHALESGGDGRIARSDRQPSRITSSSRRPLALSMRQ